MLLAPLLLLGAAPQAPATPPTLAPVQAAAKADEVRAFSYRVRGGDTLGHVVERTHAGADAIVRANKLAPPYRLRPGQLLSIPPGRYHRVRSGETGIAIGRAYGMDWSRIATLNHLEPPFQLRAGDRLLLPPAEALVLPGLEERARRFRLDLDDLVTGSAPALPPRGKAVTPKPRPAPETPADKPVAAPRGGFDGRFDWPVEGRIVRRFGATPEGGRSDGIDLAAIPGATVRAAAAGTVAWAGAYPAFGQVILVTHGGGWVTIYARIGAPLVTRGQAVTAGQPLARASGPLHFEVRSGRKPIDPLPMLPAR